MTPREAIFRPEAVEHYRKDRSQGDIIRLSPRWATIAFWSLLALVVVFLVVVSIARIDTYASGPAEVEDGTLTVLVPADDAEDIEPGAAIQYRVGDETTLVSVEEVRELPPDGASSGAGPVAAVTASVPEQVPEGPGTARVHTGKERMLLVFVPGLASLFGEQDA